MGKLSEAARNMPSAANVDCSHMRGNDRGMVGRWRQSIQCVSVGATLARSAMKIRPRLAAQATSRVAGGAGGAGDGGTTAFGTAAINSRKARLTRDFM